MEAQKQPQSSNNNSNNRRPFQKSHRPGPTRILRMDGSSTSPSPASSTTHSTTPNPTSNQSHAQIQVQGQNQGQSQSQNGRRIVMGRGARHLGLNKNAHSHTNPHTNFHSHSNHGTNAHAKPVSHTTPAQHIAGARMNVIRPDATRSMRRSTPKPLIQRGGDVIPTLAPDSIRIIPLGGVEEIGKNMTAIEYGNDIVVIDIGFQFKDENTPGIDYILPNSKYLEERSERVRAVIITHGHLDHIGGIPYIMPRIGNPPLYTRLLTSVLIQKRQEEFPHVPKLDINIIEKDQIITVGALKVKFFAVTHTIPDAMGVVVQTPHGSIVHTGDLKLDHVDGIPTDQEVAEYDRVFKDEKVLLLMADSTNVENPGFSIPEKVVHKNLEELIKNVQGRLIISTFSSLLERLIKIVEFAEKYNKRVVIEGRSLKQNIEISKHLGLLKTKKETIIGADDIENFPPDRILILATGAQGDEFAAMMRMSNKSHAKIKITPRDTILLSSSVVPGNERAVQKLKDNLSRQGAKIIHYRIADVHSSGHANRDETAWIHRKIHPKFFMPVHGYHYMLRVHADIAKEANGLKEDAVVIPDNGSIIEIQGGGARIVKLKEKVASGLILVDGFSVGDVQDVVIRDRQMLAQDGIFIVFGIMNASTGKLKKSPDIISRGFVYLRESQELLHEVRLLIKETVEKSTKGMNPLNIDFVKENITDVVSKFLLQKTAKRPMVIPVILAI